MDDKLFIFEEGLLMCAVISIIIFIVEFDQLLLKVFKLLMIEQIQITLAHEKFDILIVVKWHTQWNEIRLIKV